MTGSTFDVLEFGAVGDGVTLDTAALQAAIAACHAAGGGDVVLSSGTFLVGTVEILSGVTIVVERDAVLLGSTDIADYRTDTSKTMYRDEPHMDRCLIFARSARSIGIRGNGLIDGQGGTANFPNADDPEVHRPMLIRFVECQEIVISDITLKNPASWTSAFLYCDEITVTSVGVLSRANHNGDGLDFDGCTKVRVSDCWFETSDDSVCLQSSRSDRLCEDVVIERCDFSSNCAGIRVGLLSRGVIRGLTLSDCRFHDVLDAGVKIQMCEGGSISDLVFRRLRMVNVTRPFFITIVRQRAFVDSPVDVLPSAGTIERVTFEDITADAEKGSPDSIMFASGLPGHPIRDLTIRRVRFSSGGGATTWVHGEVPEFDDRVLAGWWPEYEKLGGPLPAFGLFARHIDGLHLEDVVLVPAEADPRPSTTSIDVINSRVTTRRTRGRQTVGR